MEIFIFRNFPSLSLFRSFIFFFNLFLVSLSIILSAGLAMGLNTMTGGFVEPTVELDLTFLLKPTVELDYTLTT
jgi:hypothetical protein